MLSFERFNSKIYIFQRAIEILDSIVNNLCNDSDSHILKENENKSSKIILISMEAK